jgi:dihydrofolate reductase
VRDLVVTENMTLDGVIDLDAGWFGPAGSGDPNDTEDLQTALREQREASDAFLTGRVTFEQMRSYWSHRPDDATGISSYLDGVPKYVVSGTLTAAEWENTTVLRGDLRSAIAGLTAAEGRDIVTTGSITLVHGLAEVGLVDEYRLFVYPVAVGRGRRLFPDEAAVRRLQLVESRAFRSGVVLLRYRTS